MKAMPISKRNRAGKSLHEMSTSELGHLFPVVLHEFSVEWADLFQAEKERILELFGNDDVVGIEHIGSTAIQGIKAKPIIDILFQVAGEVNIQNLKDNFHFLGYQINDRHDKPAPHLTFVKGYTNSGYKGQTYHVHIRYSGDWDEIRFRDYLIEHEEASREYEMLKINLAAKFLNDREAYTESKTGFIEKINTLARKHEK